ncbi:type VI secretion protein [Citrobacter farmeri]|uniref:type VI secretion system-associated protein TagO n=1 Tax=Citrobacter farmeri TaxID=67824 RepID=UPI001908F3F9|nr:type VI secretion system-associated protein TagO [Citrobacter farmeri]MBJ8746077.1 type VI secretion protein [Citrobacter farmeri]MBJ8759328.1 type VI secretion protein [Citrobacter farmeri]MBJ9018956.1 type VI secretion protein [Citrobacter farmeri]
MNNKKIFRALPLSLLILPLLVHADLTKEERFNSCVVQHNGIKRLFCFDYAVNNNLLPPLKNAADVKSCSDIVNETKRLKCYDDANVELKEKLANTSPIAQSDASQNVGNWQTSIDSSPIDDSKNVIISLSSNNYISTRFGETVSPDLVVSCREGKTQLYINWKQYLGLDSTTMLHRIDTKKAVNKTWLLSTDNNAVFYYGKTLPFIKELSSAKTLFARVVPYGENPVDAKFDLIGMEAALKPLRQACKW